MIKICWIDLETTGLDAEKHGVIQIAGIIEIQNKGKVETESFDLKCNIFPHDGWEREALEANNTTIDMIKKYEDPRVVYKKLIKILDKHVDRYNKKDKFFFAGYNAYFDMERLRAWFTKNNDTYFGSWFWFPPVDVMQLAGEKLMKKRHTLTNFKLATVASEFGIKPTGNLHDALVDIELTRELYYTMNSIQEQEGLF